MKKTHVAVAGILVLALGTTTTVAIAASKTATDVQTLTAAELRLVGVLHTYQPTVGWQAKYKAAVAAQAAALSLVNRDLSGGTPSSPPASGRGLPFTDDNGVPYSVAAIGDYDPAQPTDMMNTPNAGDRLVAIKFRVTDASAKYRASDDADMDATIVGSNDETYQASLDTVTECTDFDAGAFNLNPGESTTGCVVFEIPQALGVSEVKWEAGFGEGGTGTWGVNR